jgi:uncharacterized protein YjdB
LNLTKEMNQLINISMKTNNYFKIFCVAFVIGVISGCTKYPQYEITNPPFVNKTSLNMYVGDEIQITASPVDKVFKWSSEDEAIVRVSQTGVLTAVGEGLTTVTVASDNDKTNVDVRVRIFIPLTDINLSNLSLKLFAGDKTQIWAYPIPVNASEPVFTWVSANPDVAAVDKNGIVTAIAKGVTTVTVRSGSIEKIIPVSVPVLSQCDKTGWTVTVSDAHTDGGGKNKIIDGDYSNSGYWQSMYSPDAPLPHWAVIDMQEPVEIVRVTTQRHTVGDTKTLQYFIGDDPDPNGTWTKITEGAYASKTANHTLALDVAEPVSGRYLKLVMTDSYRTPYTEICEIDVYKFEY